MKRFFLLIICWIFIANAGYCMVDPATGEEVKGYMGSLPHVTERFQRSKPQVSMPNFEALDAFNTQRGLRPIPRENPKYVNLMLKKDKMSEYATDINELIPIVEEIINSIKKTENEQLFAARVNFLYDNVEYMRKKYLERPEHYYESYDNLISVSNKAKSILIIRNEAKTYSPYLAYGAEGYMYSPQYINSQLDYLLSELQKTIKLMKDVD